MWTLGFAMVFLSQGGFAVVIASWRPDWTRATIARLGALPFAALVLARMTGSAMVGIDDLLALPADEFLPPLALGLIWIFSATAAAWLVGLGICATALSLAEIPPSGE